MSSCSLGTSSTEDISNWVQHGNRTLGKESLLDQNTSANTSNVIKKRPALSTSPSVNNCEDMTQAMFASTSTNTNNYFDDRSLSSSSSSVMVESPLASPTTPECTGAFRKPFSVKGKFNPHISTKKGEKRKELEVDEVEASFVTLNKAVVEHLQQKQESRQVSNDADASFCNLVLAELKVMDENEKLEKKQQILQILWRKNNL